MTNETRLRIAAEKMIAHFIVNRAISSGYSISVYDGEEMVTKFNSDREAVKKFLFGTDEDTLIINSGKQGLGRIELVYGNDGLDVVHDHSTHPAVMEIMKATDEFIELMWPSK